MSEGIITTNEFIAGGGEDTSPLEFGYTERAAIYNANKSILLDAYVEGRITSNLFLRICKNAHDIVMDEDYVKHMINNDFMMDYLSDRHSIDLNTLELKLRELIKEINETPIYNNPWEGLDIVKEVNAHFRDNAYIRKFYRRHYKNENLITLINNEIVVLTDEDRVAGLEELRTILSLAADIEVSTDPEPIYNELNTILQFE